MQVFISVPSSLLVCSILYQDQEMDIQYLGILSHILLSRQYFIYIILPMDVIFLQNF